MGRGPSLSDVQIGQIIAFRQEGHSYRKVAQLVGCKKSAVGYVLTERLEKKPTKPRGRKRAISDTVRRAVVRMASKTGKAASAIRREYGLACSARTVQRYIASSPHMRLRKMKPCPKLLPRHKKQRIQFAKEMLREEEEFWRQVIFSDEKRFCLDGPDGNRFYWHDIRKELRYFSKRQKGGGGLMVWICISAKGSAKPVWVDGKIDAAKYIKVLDWNLKKAAEELVPEVWVFQQDNARPHTAKATMEWFEDMEINVMDWPACSPDLNPVENFWGYIVREVSKDFKQYDNVEQLKAAIVEVVENADKNIIKKMVMSMHTRLMEVLEKSGNKTSY